MRSPRARAPSASGVCRKACLPPGPRQGGVEVPGEGAVARLALPPSFSEGRGRALLPRPSPGLSRSAFLGVGARLSVWSPPADYALPSLSLGSLVLPRGFAPVIRPVPHCRSLISVTSGPCEPQPLPRSVLDCFSPGRSPSCRAFRVVTTDSLVNVSGMCIASV